MREVLLQRLRGLTAKGGVGGGESNRRSQEQFFCEKKTRLKSTPNGGLVRELPLFQGNLGW